MTAEGRVWCNEQVCRLLRNRLIILSMNVYSGDHLGAIILPLGVSTTEI